MNYLHGLILGIVQGITEFLPVSSSGHLVIIPYFFNWHFPVEQIFPFDVLIQLGTLLAVIIYFWKDLLQIVFGFLRGLFEKNPLGNQQTRTGWLLIIATIPAIVGGLFLKDLVEAAFTSITATAIFLLVTAAILFLADQLTSNTRHINEMNWKNALLIGFFQLLSIFPGISRSGSTIAGAVIQNFTRKDAARFSFLMSIPVMLGAGVLSVPDLLQISDLAQFLPILAIGFVSSALVGLATIHWLLRFLQNHRLRIFAYYCLALSLAILITSNIKG